MQKYKVSNDIFTTYWWSKIPAICLGKSQNWPCITRSSCLRFYLQLMINSMQKNKDISIFSSGIDDQRIFQSHLMRDNWLHAAKSNSLSSCLPLKVISREKKPGKYWLIPSKAIDAVIWLVEGISGHILGSRFFPDMWFSHNHNKHYAPFFG